MDAINIQNLKEFMRALFGEESNSETDESIDQIKRLWLVNHKREANCHGDRARKCETQNNVIKFGEWTSRTRR